MDTHKNAEKAIIELSGMKFQGLRDRLNVKFANPNGSATTGVSPLPSVSHGPSVSHLPSVAVGGTSHEQISPDAATDTINGSRNCVLPEGMQMQQTGEGMSCNKKRPPTDEKTFQHPNNKQKIAKVSCWVDTVRSLY